QAANDDSDDDDDENSDSESADNKPDIDPFDVARLVVEANRFYNQGKYYEAMIHVDELTKKRPEFVRGWIMKGSLLYVQGQKDLAKEAWEKAQEMDPKNSEIKNYLSRYR